MSRRASSKADRKRALEQIRSLRDGNLEEDQSSGRLDAYEFHEESVYKEVTDKEYEELVRKRREETPFVEDDGGALGYYDDGEEQYFDDDFEGEILEDEDPNLKVKGKGSGALSSAYIRRAKRLQRAKLGSKGDQKVTNLFFSRSSMKDKATPSATTTTMKTSRKIKEDINLDDMLEDLTSNPLEMNQMASSRKSTRPYSVYANRHISRFTPPTTSSSSSFPSLEQKAEEDEPILDQNEGYEGNMNMDMEIDSETTTEIVNPMKQTKPINEDENQEMDSTLEENQENKVKIEKPLEKPVMSRRELLFKKARETIIKPSAPMERALAPPSKPTESESSSSSQSFHIQSNEVAEWWNPNGDPEDDGNDDENEEQPSEDSGTPHGSIRMFWTDIIEIRDRPGKLYLIGKIKSPDNSMKYQSCCITIHNLQRYLYVIPRIPLNHEKSNINEMTKEERNEIWMQMHQELQHILIPSCISDRKDQQCFQTKMVERNYAFELADIPRGKSWYLKLKYHAKYPLPPMNYCESGGKTFQRIFGKDTRPIETFIIRQKLLGPSWIEIPNAKPLTNNSVSFCKWEYEIMTPKGITSLQGLAPPPMTVMSLSMKTVCHPQTQKHEIVAISCITQRNISMDGTPLKRKKKNKEDPPELSHFTTVRPILFPGRSSMNTSNGSTNGFPSSYAEIVKKDRRFYPHETSSTNTSHLNSNSTSNLRLELNERALLNYFLTRIQREDPDVIVGHNLHHYQLNVLLSRLDSYKLGGSWSRMTRLRRGRLNPFRQGEGWNEYRMDDVFNGRLFIDTYISAKEFLPSQPNYSLSYLVSSQLKKKRHDIDMSELNQLMMQTSPEAFHYVCQHTLDDAMFIMHLQHQLEILPLSKQLTNLCGYLWRCTVEGNKRAERIEYLLLHEFNKKNQKFLVPEKFKQLSKTEKNSSRKREAQYAGGMVFAPKKGLYENFVVLLDFNSLYPSIIREYNICFTTVDRQFEISQPSNDIKQEPKRKKGKHMEKNALLDEKIDDEMIKTEETNFKQDEIPSLPSSSLKEGILPNVIKRLLESRKQVKIELKKTMKKGKGFEDQVKRLDIRQKAIKLTANSMYGCLGFKNSRFYAKPIAALITHTGRQTLQRASEVATTECGYDVVYGDTDSIMVDSRTQNLTEAKQIGHEIQMKCNKKFRLLELEVDYVFKTILLLNKKKYAAIVVKENGSGEVKYEKEVKGLDMVRRDWCKLSKTIGNEILDLILSGKSREDIVICIHEALEKLREQIKSKSFPIEDFVITKSLNKPPEQYPDKNKQYHVQVALAMKSNGQFVGVGSHIPYVICKEADETNQQRKAYHPDEILRSNGKLTIDEEWYLEAQIHPPINRLCAHIEGTSSPQLAHCLGLDTSKFAHVGHTSIEDDDGDFIPSVLQSDENRFKECLPLTLQCKKCNQENSFPGIFQSFMSKENEMKQKSGLFCPNLECQTEFWGYSKKGMNEQIGDEIQALISNRLALAVRFFCSKYYLGWVHCSDSTCQMHTQQQSLYGNGNECLNRRCRGRLVMDYSDHQLYTQLKYFQALVDQPRTLLQVEKEYEKRASQNSQLKIPFRPPSIPLRHEEIFHSLYLQLEEEIRRNNYNWVKPSIWHTLFPSSK